MSSDIKKFMNQLKDSSKAEDPRTSMNEKTKLKQQFMSDIRDMFNELESVQGTTISYNDIKYNPLVIIKRPYFVGVGDTKYIFLDRMKCYNTDFEQGPYEDISKITEYYCNEVSNNGGYPTITKVSDNILKCEWYDDIITLDINAILSLTKKQVSYIKSEFNKNKSDDYFILSYDTEDITIIDNNVVCHDIDSVYTYTDDMTKDMMLHIMDESKIGDDDEFDHYVFGKPTKGFLYNMGVIFERCSLFNEVGKQSIEDLKSNNVETEKLDNGIYKVKIYK